MLLMVALLLEPLPSTQMIYRSHWHSWTGGFSVQFISPFRSYYFQYSEQPPSLRSSWQDKRSVRLHSINLVS